MEYWMLKASANTQKALSQQWKWRFLDVSLANSLQAASNWWLVYVYKVLLEHSYMP
jgi:hypothetical protein